MCFGFDLVLVCVIRVEQCEQRQVVDVKYKCYIGIYQVEGIVLDFLGYRESLFFGLGFKNILYLSGRNSIYFCNVLFNIIFDVNFFSIRIFLVKQFNKYKVYIRFEVMWSGFD